MRPRPSASSSSMKMMQGAARRACSNRSRTRAEPPEGRRIAQEGNDFLQLELRLVDAGDVLERDLGVLLDIDLGPRFADGHQAAETLPFGDAPKTVHPDQIENENREYPGQDGPDEGARWRTCYDDAVGFQLVGELRID